MSKEMTDTTAPEGYTKITWWDVREGDVLLHANGDRLTVAERDSGVRVRVAGGEIGRMDAVWSRHGFTPYRKQPELPNEPGHYLDAEGYHWKLTSNANRPWYLPGSDDHFTTEEVQDEAPFTRLVPLPSSDAVLEVVQRAEPMCMRERITDAVMALLGGDDE